MVYAFSRNFVFVVLATQLGFALAQVPSNYLPLDQVVQSFAERPSGTNINKKGDEQSARNNVQSFDIPESIEGDQYEEYPLNGSIENQPLDSVIATSKGIALPQSAIVALGSDPVQAYTAKNYPGVTRDALQRVKDVQTEYTESLASQDVVNILGRPFLYMEQGSGQCIDGQSGQFSTYYYLLREGSSPKAMAVIRFCADGMQNITTQSVR